MGLKEKWSWLDTSSKQFSGAIDAILNTDDNLFIMGPGGVGKSILLQVAFDHFRNILVMGPTGISAANLSTDGVPATTIHAALKIPPVSVYSGVKVNQETVQLISKTKIILIDEISMVNASLMDYILRVSLTSSEFVKPRIIIFGDIFQLPPVRSDNDKAISKYFNRQYDGNYFFFAADLYAKLKFNLINLDEIYRQKDPEFKNVLNRIRLGVCSDEDLDYINMRVVNKDRFLKDNPMLLYLATTNKIVNRLNLEYTSKPEFNVKETYLAVTEGKFDIKTHPGIEPEITIAKKQQVMCTCNNAEAGYQNGTLGFVEEVYSDHVLIRKFNGQYANVVRQKNEKFEYYYDEKTESVTYESVGSCEQIACKPAFAVTFHKCQGLTLDAIYIDLSSNFVPESGIYLALSRCKTLRGIGLSRPITQRDIHVSPEAIEFIIDNMEE